MLANSAGTAKKCVEHGATAGPEGALVLDVFRPVREDYRQAVGA